MLAARSSQVCFADLYQAEAERVLRACARAGGSLVEILAQQAQRASVDGTFEVARDALDELLARLARAGEVTLVAREPGWFEAHDRTGTSTTWVGACEPLDASCSCRDFRTASLGACAHVFAVLVQARHQVARSHAPAARWSPLRPLTGAGPWQTRAWCDPTATAATELRAIDGAALVEQLVSHEASTCVVEPALEALVEEERACRTRVSAVAPEAVEAALATVRAPLFPYQREGVMRFFERGRLLLADDMGLGKTVQAIAIAHVLAKLGLVRRALVVVPSSLKSQWFIEWRRFSDQHPLLLEGSRIVRRLRYAAWDGVIIASYDQVRRDSAAILHAAPELVVLDEAQRIKNADTQTARSVKQLVAPWRLALSGTPLQNRLADLTSIVEWIDELALAPRWRDATRDVMTVRERLASCMLRRTRAEVLEQLPERRDIVVPVPMTPPQQLAHDRLARAIAELAGAMRRRRLTREESIRLIKLMTQQRLICNGIALYRFDEEWPALGAGDPAAAEMASPKLAVVRALLESLLVDQQRKVVVFSQWRRMLQLVEWACAPLLAGSGLEGVYFTGAETVHERAANVKRFHESPRVSVLWATDVGGVGLNLQRAASACIELDVPWNPATQEQRISRIYRTGQREPVDAYHLVADGIEGRIAQALAEKRALFAGILDGVPETMHETMHDTS
jgi:SNF2 family DNA or RNA helicase